MTHEERVRAIQGACEEANRRLAGRLDALDEAAAAAAPGDGWTPAQIVWHVARVNDALARSISGGLPAAILPRPDGFTESLATRQFPEKMKAPASAEPPPDAPRQEALAHLRDSADALARAVATITPERAAAEVVRLPFGICSLYEAGEFAAAHARRHNRQLKRTVGAP